MKVLISNIKAGDIFYYERQNSILEYKEIGKMLENRRSSTIYNSIGNMAENKISSYAHVYKLIPDNKLSRVIYPNYVPCREVSGYLIPKEVYL